MGKFSELSHVRDIRGVGVGEKEKRAYAIESLSITLGIEVAINFDRYPFEIYLTTTKATRNK